MIDKQQRTIYIVIAILLYTLPIFVKSQYYLTVGIFVFIYSVLTLGLRMIMKVGEVSFAHAAFMGVGAYSSALLTMKAHVPFLLAVTAALAITAFLALLLGFLAVRTKGVHFFIVTLAMGETIRLIAMNWNAPLLGGPNGIYGIPAPGPLKFGSFVIAFDSRAAFYLMALFSLTLVVLLSSRLDRSRLGRIWDIIGQDEKLASVIGIDVYRHKLASFVISSTVAGLGGVIFAHVMTYISPYDFTFFFAVQLLVYVIFGGVGTLVGPIMGVAVLVTISEVLRKVGQYDLIFYGFVVIMVLRFFPQGMVSLVGKALGRRRTSAY